MGAPGATALNTLFQVNMPVRDIGRAIVFYRDLLGIRFLAQRGSLAFFDMEGVRLLLEVVPEEGSRYAHPGSILYFRVPDIQQAFTELGGRGVEFIEDPAIVSQNAQHATWMAFFDDGEWNTHAITSQIPVLEPHPSRL